jgi:hypothetical protein
MRPMYRKVTLIMATATERDEGTDLLPRQCEWVVRISHHEDGEHTRKHNLYPTQCKDSEEACVPLSVLYNCLVKPDKKADPVLYRISLTGLSEVQSMHFSCINSNDSRTILCMMEYCFSFL